MNTRRDCLELNAGALLVYLCVAMGSLLAGGCNWRRPSIEQRITNAMSDARRDAEMRAQAAKSEGRDSGLANRVDRLLISSLSSVAPEDLERPVVVATWFERKSDGIRLWLLWLQDTPTLNAISLQVGGLESKQIGFEKYYIDSNDEAAKTSVRFSFVALLPLDSAIAKELVKNWGKAHVVVTLFDNGQPAARAENVLWGDSD